MAAVPPPPLSTSIPQRPDPRWPLLDVRAAEFWPLVVAPFGVVMLSYMLIVGFFDWQGDGGMALLTLIQQLALAVPVAVWVRRRTGSFAALGLGRDGWSGRDVGVGVGMGVLALVASLIVLAITVGVVEQLQGHPIEFPSDAAQGNWFWAFAVMAVLFAPVCEELYFRGFLFQGLRRWMRFAWAGLASGAMFAFVHVEPIRFFSLCLTGIVFAAVFERRKTLVASMCAHATLNLIAITLAVRAR